MSLAWLLSQSRLLFFLESPDGSTIEASIVRKSLNVKTSASLVRMALRCGLGSFFFQYVKFLQPERHSSNVIKKKMVVDGKEHLIIAIIVTL